MIGGYECEQRMLRTVGIPAGERAVEIIAAGVVDFTVAAIIFSVNILIYVLRQ